MPSCLLPAVPRSKARGGGLIPLRIPAWILGVKGCRKECEVKGCSLRRVCNEVVSPRSSDDAREHEAEQGGWEACAGVS